MEENCWRCQGPLWAVAHMMMMMMIMTFPGVLIVKVFFLISKIIYALIVIRCCLFQDLQLLLVCMSLAESEITPYQLSVEHRMLLSERKSRPGTGYKRRALHSIRLGSASSNGSKSALLNSCWLLLLLPFNVSHILDGRRLIGISWSLIWSKTMMELMFNPCGEFQWSPEGPVSQIHSPHLLVGAPGIFSDLLRSVQMLKREWGAESNGKLPRLLNL